MECQMTGNLPGLKRALGLRALVLYGIVLTQPTAPMPCYGVVCDAAQGHVVTAILIGMLAMLFTAVSYGRMARIYPNAGSAYTYVGRELHPAAGYLTGWAMIFDYLLNPIICAIWCSKAAMTLDFMPQVPYAVWAVLFIGLFTTLNVRRIEASDRTNQWMAVVLGIVIVFFLASAVRYLSGMSGLAAPDFLRPFYDPQTFSFSRVSTGTSIAVLTYIGFDAVSTLSEEARNPRRDILLATVLTCLVVGILSAVQVYAAQMVHPENTFVDKDTAIPQIAGKIGGRALLLAVTMALLMATVGSGIGSQLAAGRLLYSMGRDGALPSRFFAAVAPRTRIPRNNILLVGAVALFGVFLISYEMGAQLLNFGAFIGFMGVNLSAFVRFYLRVDRKRPLNLVMPILGFLICLFLWLSLRTPAKIVGIIWLVIGLCFGAWQTRGFRQAMKDPTPEDESRQLGDHGGNRETEDH